MDDATLMQRVARGEQDAVSTLYARYQATIIRYVESRGSFDSDDIAQQTLISAWRKAHTFQPGRVKLVTWVLSIARHKVVDAIRYASSHRPAEPLGERDFAAPGGTDPDAPTEARKALAAMTPKQRSIAVAVGWSGYRGAAAAEGLPAGTIKSNLHNAKVRVRR